MDYRKIIKSKLRGIEPAGSCCADVLDEINKKIEDVLLSIIKNGSVAGAAIKPISIDLSFPGLQPRRCFEIKDCCNEECAAYKTNDHRCWLIAGTLCSGTDSIRSKGKMQGQKHENCLDCDVYREITRDPQVRMVESVNMLINSLAGQAEMIRQFAIKDSLTGLFNRHFFREVAEKEVSRARRNAEPLSVIILDVNYFKFINDNFGHAVGDSILREIAGILLDCSRKSDIAFRLGGDEFMLLLMNTCCKKSQVVADRISMRVQEWNETRSGEFGGAKISLSIGCAECQYNEGKTIDDAIRQADDEMYRDKRTLKARGNLAACYLNSKCREGGATEDEETVVREAGKD